VLLKQFEAVSLVDGKLSAVLTMSGSTQGAGPISAAQGAAPRSAFRPRAISAGPLPCQVGLG